MMLPQSVDYHTSNQRVGTIGQLSRIGQPPSRRLDGFTFRWNWIGRPIPRNNKNLGGLNDLFSLLRVTAKEDRALRNRICTLGNSHDHPFGWFGFPNGSNVFSLFFKLLVVLIVEDFIKLYQLPYDSIDRFRHGVVQEQFLLRIIPLRFGGFHRFDHTRAHVLGHLRDFQVKDLFADQTFSMFEF